MSVIELKSKKEFDELIEKNPYVAIQAHASWCGPCKMISPMFNKHATALQKDDVYAFAKFDTDDVPDLAFELGIRSIPAFFFFENGNKDQTVTGANPGTLKKAVEAYQAKIEAGPAAAAPAAPAAEKKEEETLKTDENF